MRTLPRAGGFAICRYLRATLAALVVITPCGAQSVAATLATPATVSPGGLQELKTIADGCPSFSWSDVPSTNAYELVVYRLPKDTAADSDEESLALRERLPGGVFSWTPSLARCLDPGGRYAWSVGAWGREGASEWSEPRLFEVASGPSPVRLREALALLERYLAQGGSLDALVALAVSDSRPEPETRAKLHLGSSHASASRGPVGSAAIRGDQSDLTGATIGVAGSSASPDGAGLTGANTGGGADLMLDGVANGETDTLFTQAAIDRPSSSVESFEIGNTGGGGLTLTIDGVEAVTTATDQDALGSLGCDEGQIAKLVSGVWDCALDNNSGGDITSLTAGPGLDGGALAGDATVLVEPLGITNGMLGPDSVTSEKIAPDSITAADLAAGSVGASEIVSAEVQLRVASACPPQQAIVAIALDGGVVCSPVNPQNIISTVDDPDNFVGQYTSIAIGNDGYPVISYQDGTDSSLEVAKCNDVACADGDETITTVDDPTNLVGYYTSIAIGDDGLPVISYYDGTNLTLKVIKCGTASCR